MRAFIVLVFCVFNGVSCLAQTNIEFLIGTWKVEGKQKYETWSIDDHGNLYGEGFKWVNDEKVLLETLAIIKKDGELVYQATVPDQNEGRTIDFVSNKSTANSLSFENPTHDFPTQIVYQKVNENRLFVEVSGQDGDGFSFYMDRE